MFPDGQFDARDGRPGSIDGCVAKSWWLDAAIAAALTARANQRETRFASATSTTPRPPRPWPPGGPKHLPLCPAGGLYLWTQMCHSVLLAESNASQSSGG